MTEEAEKVAEAYRELRELCREAKWDAAKEVAAELPPGDLNGHPHHALWWQFVEALADRLDPGDRALARRLYDLAETSWVKEKSMATSAAEAAGVQPHLDRVRQKLAAARAS